MAKARKKASKKKATKKKSTRGRGRPAGSRSVLPQGTVRAIKAEKKLKKIATAGGYSEEVLNHPRVKELLGVIHDIAMGVTTGRYVGERMRACTTEIEIIAGKLSSKTEVDAGPTLAGMLANVERKNAPSKS